MSKLMFSKSADLLCETTDGINYYVLNGCWEGKRIRDDFHILGGILDDNEEYYPKIKITDWKEYTREEFDKAYPDFGY